MNNVQTIIVKEQLIKKDYAVCKLSKRLSRKFAFHKVFSYFMYKHGNMLVQFKRSHELPTAIRSYHVLLSVSGLQVGDELLVLNGLMVSELDMVYIEWILTVSDVISLTVRSCRTVAQTCRTSAHFDLTEDPALDNTQMWISHQSDIGNLVHAFSMVG